jgi:hypothetical protein
VRAVLAARSGRGMGSRHSPGESAASIHQAQEKPGLSRAEQIRKQHRQTVTERKISQP